jgi:hypothetical protein
MKRITITISRKGLPRQRFTGLFASTADAIISALEIAGTEPCSISAKVQP